MKGNVIIFCEEILTGWLSIRQNTYFCEVLHLTRKITLCYNILAIIDVKIFDPKDEIVVNIII